MSEKRNDLNDMLLNMYNGMFNDMTKEWRAIKDKRIAGLLDEIKALKKNERLAEKDVLRLKEACNRLFEKRNDEIFQLNQERGARNILVNSLQVRINELEMENHKLRGGVVHVSKVETQNTV